MPLDRAMRADTEEAAVHVAPRLRLTSWWNIVSLFCLLHMLWQHSETDEGAIEAH